MTVPAGPAVVVLDVGHGNSTLLMENDWAVLVDARRGGVVDDALLRFGITVLDDVVISHGDTDHCDGASTLVLGDPCQVRRLHMKADPFKDKRRWRDLIVALEEAEAGGQVELRQGPQRGDRLQRPDGGRMVVDVLAPTAPDMWRAPHPELNRGLNTNGMSTVLRVSVDGTGEVLLPGDLDGAGLTRLTGRGDDLAATTLVFPHHGGTAGGEDPVRFTARLLEAVRPEHVIFSVKRNDGLFPRPEIVAEVRRLLPGSRVSCTQLSSRCSSTVPDSAPTHLAPLPAAGLSRSCCAGSLHLSWEPTQVVPAHARHLAFIAANASAPMCGQA